jgi:low temperature requirement protein LtrA
MAHFDLLGEWRAQNSCGETGTGTVPDLRYEAAMTDKSSQSLLRNHGGGHAPVSYLELFFDLVYVFAITQISHFLHYHPGWLGLAQSAVLFLALWWAWMFTTWAANWADPERVPVRLLLIALMFLSLTMAVAIPDAFGPLGLLFAASYVVLQIGRTFAMVLIFRGTSPANARNMLRITLWFVASAPLWIGGAFAEPSTRLVLWGLAIALEYSGPLAYFRVPGLARSDPSEWNISGGHMAERCALFVIIALGEGVVMTGAAVAKAGLSEGNAIAFALAFLGSALMWWLYFDLGAPRATQHIVQQQEPGRMARNAYTYLHMPIAAGIVVYAVSDAILLDAPRALASPGLVATLCGGGILFLAGLALFKRTSNRHHNVPLSHWAGMALFAALALAGITITTPALLFAGAGQGILMVVAIWEWGSYHGGWRERFGQIGSG